VDAIAGLLGEVDFWAGLVAVIWRLPRQRAYVCRLATAGFSYSAATPEGCALRVRGARRMRSKLINHPRAVIFSVCHIVV
jgi:hypothetical protein